MKIMITILRKNGECRTWTNSTAEEHLVMGLTAYAEGVKRCAESCEEETCYIKGEFSPYQYYKSNGYEILEWSDYTNKEFTKADLRDGMVVKHRNGDKKMVISEALIGEDGYSDRNCFREDLTYRYFKDLDIVGVYAIKEYSNFADMLSDYNLELIWERKEPKKMTVEEMRQKLEELTGEEIEVME